MQFSISKSSNGTIGLITSQDKVEHTYQEGKVKKVWTGIIIKDNTFKGRGQDSEKTIEAKIGGFWSSSNAEIIDELCPKNILDMLVEFDKTASQFAVAKSSNGTIGLITSKDKVDHTYQEGTVKKVWTGVILQDNTFKGRGQDTEKTIEAKTGGFWSSTEPEVLGYIMPKSLLSN